MGERLVVVEPATVHHDAWAALGQAACNDVDGEVGLANAGGTGHDGDLRASQLAFGTDKESGRLGEFLPELAERIDRCGREPDHVLALPLPPALAVPGAVLGVHRFDFQRLLRPDDRRRGIESLGEIVEPGGGTRDVPRVDRIDDCGTSGSGGVQVGGQHFAFGVPKLVDGLGHPVGLVTDELPPLVIGAEGSDGSRGEWG